MAAPAKHSDEIEIIHYILEYVEVKSSSRFAKNDQCSKSIRKRESISISTQRPPKDLEKEKRIDQQIEKLHKLFPQLNEN